MELINCIQRIPKSLKDILNDYGKNVNWLKNIKTKKINIIGSGTSYNSGQIAKYFLEKHTDLRCEVIYPNVFLSDIKLEKYDKDEIFIFVSQGGTTKLVLECLEIIKDAGFYTISITENSNSPISNKSDLFIDMLSYNEEYIFRTIGFSCTTLILCILGLKIENKYNEEIEEDIKNVINNLENIEKIATNWFLENGENFNNSENFIFIGNEILYPIVQEANIKFIEMLPKLCSCYELEESIHGPQNAFNKKMTFFMLNNGQDTEKNLSIYEFIKNEISSKTAIIGNLEMDGCINIKPKGKYFYYLEYVCFIQYLAYYFAKSNDRNLEKPTYPQLDNYIKKKL